MLSSAKKSVPTIKQFIQPYFIEIAPDGAIKAVCARFTSLLQKRNIYSFLQRKLEEVFSRLGKPALPIPSDPEKDGFPDIIDLAVNWPGTKPFIIRWTPTPLHSTEGKTAGWQLTGMKIFKDNFIGKGPNGAIGVNIGGITVDNEGIGANNPTEAPLLYRAYLAEWVSDIIIYTDLRNQVLQWNKQAENFYGIPASQAIGKDFRKLAPYTYGHHTEEEVTRSLRESGFWLGELAFISDDRKKSYLLCSIRTIRDKEGKISGILTVNKDITENKGTLKDRKRAETQLHLYSEQITNILESITDGFFVLDKNFKVVLWNHEAERITNLSYGEVVGQIIWERLPELVDKDAQQSFQQAFSKKETVALEQYNKRSDRWLEMCVYPSVRGLFVYFKDVTARKKQEMLLDLEKKMLELNSGKKASLQSILNHFLKGIEKIFPDMYCSVLAFDEEGMCLRQLSAPGLPAAYSQEIDGLVIGPEAGSCGTAVYRKEKVIVSDITTDPLWAAYKEIAIRYGLMACWSFPIRNVKEEVLAAFAAYYKFSKSPTEVELNIIERASNLVTVIMESKRAEEELNLSNERYTLATKATNDAIWDRDMYSELYFWGEGFYHQFGYKPGPKVRTRKFWEMHLHPDDRETVLQNMEKFIDRKNKDLWHVEYRFKKADGTFALISDNAYLIFGKEGKVIRMVGSMQDITEKREMERQLLNQQLNKQKLIAQAMLDAQEKERAEIGKELHDNINQILSTTKLYLELAKTDNKERLRLINRSSENIHEAIHEIRNISRSLVPASIGDLGLLDSISDLVESIKTTRAIHVEFYPVGKFDEKISDKEKLMLFRIIQEQVNNVLKHSGARNMIIELILGEGGKRIELTITDDGKGFNPEKVKNKKGLGLSNIISRADLFGGKVTIVSSPGKGCKIRVQVPVQNEPVVR
ncbi:PAS domain S-box protein [Flavitalea flava]